MKEELQRDIKDLESKIEELEDALFELNEGREDSRFVDTYPEQVLKLELEKRRYDLAYLENPDFFGDDTRYENDRDDALSFKQN